MDILVFLFPFCPSYNHISANFWAGGKSTSAPLMGSHIKRSAFSVSKHQQIGYASVYRVSKYMEMICICWVPHCIMNCMFLTQESVSFSLSAHHRYNSPTQVQNHSRTRWQISKKQNFFFKLLEIYENSLVYWPKQGCVQLEPLDWWGKPIKAYNGSTHWKTAPGKGFRSLGPPLPL